MYICVFIYIYIQPIGSMYGIFTYIYHKNIQRSYMIIYDDSQWGKVKVYQISLHLSRMLAFVHRLCSNFSHAASGNSEFLENRTSKSKQLLQGGPLPYINGVITPING